MISAGTSLHSLLLCVGTPLCSVFCVWA